MASNTAPGLGPAGSYEVVDKLQEYLSHIAACTVPELRAPPEMKGRRASVAVVVRIQAHPSHRPASVPSSPPGNLEDSSYHVVAKDDAEARYTDPVNNIKSFFTADWTQYGDAECLFIKRASRIGDKWTGHVALPGGKRDPEDESDRAAAIRECMEEVGLDIGPDRAIFCGPLPQRFVITNWGKSPLMILCPFVFLLVDSEPPALDLQATEVAAAFWVPLRAIMHPGLRTFEAVDVSARLAKNGWQLYKRFFGAMLGPMYNSAIRLAPSSIMYSTRDNSFLPPLTDVDTHPSTINTVSDVTMKLWTTRQMLRSNKLVSEAPLLLWGITYGVLADMLEVISNGNFMQHFSYPFFGPWDYQLWSRAFSLSYRWERSTAINDGLWRDVPTTTNAAIVEGRDKSSAVHYIFEGYYKYHDRAVIATLSGRALLFAGLLWWNWKSGWVVGVHRFRQGGGIVSLLGGLLKFAWTGRRR